MKRKVVERSFALTVQKKGTFTGIAPQGKEAIFVIMLVTCIGTVLKMKEDRNNDQRPSEAHKKKVMEGKEAHIKRRTEESKSALKPSGAIKKKVLEEKEAQIKKENGGGKRSTKSIILRNIIR